MEQEQGYLFEKPKERLQTDEEILAEAMEKYGEVLKKSKTPNKDLEKIISEFVAQKKGNLSEKQKLLLPEKLKDMFLRFIFKENKIWGSARVSEQPKKIGIAEGEKPLPDAKKITGENASGFSFKNSGFRGSNGIERSVPKRDREED
jgi:hypothetical protein